MRVTLNKSTYSEQVVRKALYWLTERCSWELDQDELCWTVNLLPGASNTDECKSELDRLLNDFLLREQLDKRTRGMRLKIVEAALAKLGEHGPQS